MPHRADYAANQDGSAEARSFVNRDIQGYFAAAIAAGDLVAIDVATTTYGVGKAFKKATASEKGLVCGVALETLVDSAGAPNDVPRFAQIRVQGHYPTVNVATGTAAGKRLLITATDGRGGAIDGVLNFEQYSVPCTTLTAEGGANTAQALFHNPLGL